MASITPSGPKPIRLTTGFGAASGATIVPGEVPGGADLLIELSGELDSMQRVGDVIVNTGVSGSATRIADLGRVYRATVTPPYSIALAQGKPAILVGAAMEYGGQIDRWGASFRKLVEEFRGGAPAGVLIEQTYDQSEYAQSRLNQVGANLALGMVLVLLVLLVTLGWRGALENLALCVILLVLPFVILTVRGKPSDIGALPEGAEAGDEDHAAASPELGLADIIRHPAYWFIAVPLGLLFAVYASMLANIAPYATGLGASAAQASTLIMVVAIVGLVVVVALIAYLMSLRDESGDSREDGE